MKSEQGDIKAQYNLGLAYANGKGVLQDYVMAHMYFNIAVFSRDKTFVKNKGVFEKKMTLLQLAEAQKLAQEWLRTHQ